jgi:hypothetical protein
MLGIVLLGPIFALATSEGDGVPDDVNDTKPNLESLSDIDPKRFDDWRSGGLKGREGATVADRCRRVLVLPRPSLFAIPLWRGGPVLVILPPRLRHQPPRNLTALRPLPWPRLR